MSNTEWKKGYEEGFAAGWKAAKKDNTLGYQNYPPVYYGGVRPQDNVTIAGAPGAYSFSGGTMADTTSYVTAETPTVTFAKIGNLTDHTLIV